VQAFQRAKIAKDVQRTRQSGRVGEVGSGQIGGGCKAERHSVIYSQIVDFFHYRDRWDERPSGAPVLWWEEPQKHCGKESEKVYNFDSRLFPSPEHLTRRWWKGFISRWRGMNRRAPDELLAPCKQLAAAWLHQP